MILISGKSQFLIKRGSEGIRNEMGSLSDWVDLLFIMFSAKSLQGYSVNV